MLWEVLLIGSFWWWLLSFGWFCILIFLIEEERGTLGTFTILLGLAVVQLFSDFNIVKWMWENPLWVGAGAISYFVIGAVWGTIKWTLFSKDKREKYDESKEYWLEPENLKRTATNLRSRASKKGVSDTRKAQIERWANALDAAAAQGGGVLTDALKPAWTNERADARRRWEEEETDVMPVEIPHPKDNKARIMRWMGHWPWSMFWTMLNDPIRRIAKMVYKRMTVILVSIGQRSFAGVEDDFVIEDNEDDVAPPQATATHPQE